MPFKLNDYTLNLNHFNIPPYYMSILQYKKEKTNIVFTQNIQAFYFQNG